MSKKYNVSVQPEFATVIKTNACASPKSIKEIGDVYVGPDVADGFVLVYDSILGKWIAEELSISVDGGIY